MTQVDPRQCWAVRCEVLGDPDNQAWAADGYLIPTKITCDHCNATSDLKYVKGELVCSWHRTDMRRWADEVLDQHATLAE